MTGISDAGALLTFHDFARKLETELTGAKAEIERLRQLDSAVAFKRRESIKTMPEEELRKYCHAMVGRYFDAEQRKKRAEESLKQLGEEIEKYAEITFAKDKLIEQMRQALSWYDENVSNCNRHGREGDNARNRLARDGGQQAKFALEAAERITTTPGNSKCIWTNEEDTDIWVSTCGYDFVLINGDQPKEKDFKFCPKCGKKIEVENEVKD
jgi:hypothetical protein